MNSHLWLSFVSRDEVTHKAKANLADKMQLIVKQIMRNIIDTIIRQIRNAYGKERKIWSMCHVDFYQFNCMLFDLCQDCSKCIILVKS